MIYANMNKHVYMKMNVKVICSCLTCDDLFFFRGHPYVLIPTKLKLSTGVSSV